MAQYARKLFELHTNWFDQSPLHILMTQHRIKLTSKRPLYMRTLVNLTVESPI